MPPFSLHALLLALAVAVHPAVAQESSIDAALPAEAQEMEPDNADILPADDDPALAPDTEAGSAEPAEAETEALVNPNPLSGLDMEALSATRTLPLFTPSRTAPVVPEPIAEVEPEPAPVEPEPEQPPPPLQLVGIVLTASAQTALLRDPSSNEVHRIRPGEDYEGWKLSILDASSVEFRSGERVEGLKMFESFPTPPDAHLDEFEMETPRRQNRIAAPPGEPPQEEFEDFDAFDEGEESDETFEEGDDLQGQDMDADVESTGSAGGQFAPALGNAPIPEEGPLQEEDIEPTEP